MVSIYVTGSDLYPTRVNFSNTVYASYPVKVKFKKETKKERIARIAKEKMLASWKTHNEKPLNVIQMKQLCKPRHKLTRIKRYAILN